MDRGGDSGETRPASVLFWKLKEDTAKGGLTSCDRKGMICAKIVFSLLAISVCKKKKRPHKAQANKSSH